MAAGLGLVFRYRWIFDDSFVYFRYIDNLLFLKIGLVFNAGEFVEGYTSPLQCLLLMAWRTLHLSYPVIVAASGFCSFVLFWYLLVALNRAFRPETTWKTALNFPLCFLAANYSVASFFTAGNETALVHVVAAANALFILRPRSRLAAILVAASPLARPELAATLLVTFIIVWVRRRRFPGLLAGAALLFNGGWLAFRIVYYADLLPNSFYLKEGTHLDWGRRYLLDLAQPYHLGTVLLVFAVLLVVLAAKARRGGSAAIQDLKPGSRAAILLLAGTVAAYVVRTGGSAMHYYYLAAPFVLVICSLGGLLEAAADRLPAWNGPVPRFAAMMALFLLLGSFYPENLSRHPITRRERMVEKPSPSVLTDPSYFRHLRAFQEAAWPAIPDLVETGRILRKEGYRQWSGTGRCAYAYRHPAVRCIQRFGLTDGILARVDTPEQKRGHKRGLKQLSRDIIQLQKEAPVIGRGMARRAVMEGTAPDWMEPNLASIEIIEKKMFNRHDFAENLRLVLTFPPKIQLY
ncbi:MAG: hypothetical protein ACE5ID_03740 [Acidobacteriota bacterium]